MHCNAHRSNDDRPSGTLLWADSVRDTILYITSESIQRPGSVASSFDRC
jgi:hypothetical protein